MTIDQLIAALVQYGTDNGLVRPEDRCYTVNSLLPVFRLEDYTEPEEVPELSLPEILSEMLSYALEKGILASDDTVSRDLFDTQLMGKLTPLPSTVIDRFRENYRKSPETATGEYYRFSKATNYIRTDRVKKDVKWIVPSEFGDIDITINLSKPEKDPKAIAAALSAKNCNYPKCQLCRENEGYAGRMNHPARENHRIIPLTMNNEDWFLQYSPYVYYNEHCIVFNAKHTPMKINHAAFVKLFDFITLFPHYFLGSNADLPIVGGSILTHDHFQGGHYEFAMAKAPVETELTFAGYPDIKAGIVKWPMSVIRLTGPDKNRIISLCDKILEKWRGYSDPSCFIFAETDGVSHNTITPIARRRGTDYEMDLVLRNNIQTEEHPLGVFHPHAEHHHIKKENIGLIEVMGLAVLPSRLKKEMSDLCAAVTEGRDFRNDEVIGKHADWVEEIGRKLSKEGRSWSPDYEENKAVLRKEIGNVFVDILCQAGVYKRDENGREGFLRFCEAVR